MSEKITVIHHSADFDGLFCREIARKFLPDAELIGWDFGDAPLEIPSGLIYVMDLPIDRVFGFDYSKVGNNRGLQHLLGLVWIDHHKSSIESHPTGISGYRIDGVAACRLAWQWFDSPKYEAPVEPLLRQYYPLPTKQDFIDRNVSEPLAVRLAGEYDIWDKRDPRAELFQHGLRSQDLGENMWDLMLVNADEHPDGVVDAGTITVMALLENGKALQYARTRENESIIKEIGFTIQWEGLTFLACNAARYNSHLFTAGLKPEHDACFGFKWTGKKWSVSLYHAPGKEHLDLSLIAKQYGGGGHRGACGFQCEKLPFL